MAFAQIQRVIPCRTRDASLQSTPGSIFKLTLYHIVKIMVANYLKDLVLYKLVKVLCKHRLVNEAIQTAELKVYSMSTVLRLYTLLDAIRDVPVHVSKNEIKLAVYAMINEARILGAKKRKSRARKVVRELQLEQVQEEPSTSRFDRSSEEEESSEDSGLEVERRSRGTEAEHQASEQEEGEIVQGK